MAERRPLQPWEKAAIGVCNTDMLKDIVADNRPPPRPAAEPSTVTIVGSGRVQDFDVGPAYRPIDPRLLHPKEEAPAERSGWKDGVPLRQPDGVALVDQLVDQQDMLDFAARAQQLAAASGLSYADWLRLTERQLRERKERLEKKLKDKEVKK
jgi:hypothetical protein